MADSLLLGREAHAYVVEQGGESLADLLQAPRRTITGAALEVASQVRGILRPAVPRPVTAEGRANILGLVRAGTSGRSLTFVVFREEPSDDWLRGHGAEGVPVDVGRLVSRETPMTMVSVTVGAPGTPEHDGDRVLAAVLQEVAARDLALDEVQLPVAPPVPAGPEEAGLVWFRVRIRVRDSDVGALVAALDALVALDPPGGLRILVSAAGAGRPSWLVGGPGPGSPGSSRAQVRPDDLDVLGLRGPVRPSSGPAGLTELRAPEWWVAAVCGNSRNGLERDVVQWLAEYRPGLHLAGFTAVLLHGMTVMFLLGHEPGGAVEPPSFDELRATHPGDRLELRCARRWELAGLVGPQHGADQLLVRVQLRSPERPGTLAGSLEALQRGLGELWPETDSAGGWRRVERPRSEVWYARVRVVEGRIDESVLTVRVPRPAAGVQLGVVLAETEQRVRDALAQLGDPRRNGSARVMRGHREDIVVRIRPVLADGFVLPDSEA